MAFGVRCTARKPRPLKLSNHQVYWAINSESPVAFISAPMANKGKECSVGFSRRSWGKRLHYKPEECLCRRLGFRFCSQESHCVNFGVLTSHQIVKSTSASVMVFCLKKVYKGGVTDTPGPFPPPLPPPLAAPLKSFINICVATSKDKFWAGHLLGENANYIARTCMCM